MELRLKTIFCKNEEMNKEMVLYIYIHMQPQTKCLTSGKSRSLYSLASHAPAPVWGPTSDLQDLSYVNGMDCRAILRVEIGF